MGMSFSAWSSVLDPGLTFPVSTSGSLPASLVPYCVGLLLVFNKGTFYPSI